MRIYADTMSALGRTPLVRLNALDGEIRGELIGKLERFNPTGSVKDRAAFAMIADAERSGKLTKDSVIVEGTSGNTGIALAAIAAAKGYRSVLVMPDTISQEKVRQIRSYGAEVVFTPGIFGMKRAFAEAERIASGIPNAFVPNQSRNLANPAIHRATTGPEIWADTEGSVDVFVSGVGTGGTLTGVAEFLKEKSSGRVQIVAVEPSGSPVLSGGAKGPHRIEGIGVGFIPEVLRVELIDRVETVSDDEARETVRALSSRLGLSAGISSGAAVCAARRIACEPSYAKKVVVVILPDSGERYVEPVEEDASQERSYSEVTA